MKMFKNGLGNGLKNRWMKKVVIAASLLAVLPSLAKADILEGVVRLSTPVAGATIQIVDSSGHVLAERTNATSDDGVFSIDVPGKVTELLRVEATTADGTTHLYGGIPPGFDASADLVHLNVATTLASRYRDLNPQVDQTTAETQVRKTLGLPEAMDLGPSVENPHLTILSQAVVEGVAAQSGGLDVLTQQLATEMSTDPNTVHIFATPQNLNSVPTGIADTIAEKLANSILDSAGSAIFAKLQEGLGIQDGTSQILDQLKLVMAQIAKLSAQMDEMTKELKEAQYNIRAQLIWDEWGEVSKTVAKIMDQNTKALANMTKDGKVIDATKAASIAGNIKTYEADLIRVADNFITHVNTRFVVGDDAKPLQQLYAEKLLGNMIDAKYLTKVGGHVEKYRSQQIVAMALLVDTYRAQKNTPAAETAITVNKPLIDTVKVIYPDGRIFTMTDTLARVAKNQAFYDRTQNALWETTFMHWTDRGAFLSYRSNRPKGRPAIPSREQIGYMLGLAGQASNTRFDQMAKNLGFAEQEAAKVKMIVTNTYSKTYGDWPGQYTINYFDWFGNDRDPREVFYAGDSEGSFERVRNDKQMITGFYTLGLTPLAELSN